MNKIIIASSHELKMNDTENFYSKEDIRIFKEIQAVISESWLVDRTDQISLPFRSIIKNENKIPDFLDCKNLKLQDICIERAKEFFKKNQEIFFLWSGGIDSTLALVSFLELEDGLDQITIVCNIDSIKENYKFYNQHIRNNFKLLSSESFMQKLKFGDISGIFLSCEQGDLMSGQDFGMGIFEIFGPGILEKKLDRNIIETFFKINGMSEKSANCWYDIFSHDFDKSPRPIKTIYDFSWWAGYNWRWQWAKEKTNIRFEKDIQVETFYDSKDLQWWSINHEQNKILNKKDFKKEMKQIICDYAKDYSFMERIKHPSATIYFSLNSFVAIDSTNKKYKSSEFTLKEFYQEDNFISQWIKDF